MSLDDQYFQLRMTSKQLARESKKAESSSKANKLKCKKEMERNNVEGARIFAESAIRDNNQSVNYLKLSNRLDAVAQRVNTAIKMKATTKAMKGIVCGMETALESMDPETISNVMDKFEKQFEDLDVTSKVMENSMSTSTAQTTPLSEVDALMSQVAEEHHLEFESQLDKLSVDKKKSTTVSSAEKKEDKVEVKLGGSSSSSSSSSSSAKESKSKSPSSSASSSSAASSSSSAASSSSSSSAAAAEDDLDAQLEARLRRLQGGKF
eukprot:TRINITY_DN1404_c0_g1_i1.p1 TRINITY_DN1404_c0_g1~~TRINITY_DN1404_c0_g1_i1.p1  ORF type:complete len:265 (-),score=103.61 TRINITY_DN1404_c0_g1_i1:95-889(-)